MAEIEHLKKQRRMVRAGLTRIFNYCSEEGATSENVRVRAERAEEVFAQYNEVQDKIDEWLPENPEEENYRVQIEDMFYAIKARHYQLQGDNGMRAQETVQQGNPDIASAMQVLMQNQNSMATLMERFTSNVRAEDTSTPNEQNRQVRNDLQLPRIQLPDFDGNLLDWVRFKNLFEALVHTKTNISNVEKLDTKLTGEELVVIKHLKPTNANYEIAWQILKKKYDNIEKIKNSYLELILDQPRMKAFSLSEIKRVYNNCNEGFNALMSIEENVGSWSSVLLFNVEKKLENNTAELWFREKGSIENATFQRLLEFMEKKISELESISKNGGIEKAQQRYQFRTHAAVSQVCPMCPQ